MAIYMYLVSFSIYGQPLVEYCTFLLHHVHMGTALGFFYEFSIRK